MTSLATPLGQPTPTAAPAAQPFGARIVVGLLGVLLASLTAGLNGHVTEIAMTDAVSYTHLDVYKRQSAPCSVSPVRWSRCSSPSGWRR